MAYAAILGYGTVGSGVAAVLNLNKEIIAEKAGETVTVKRILDLRDFKGDEFETLITHDFKDILQDDEISVVAEVMGGLSPAHDYVKALLETGKSVVTSNKELVSVYGAELLQTAYKNGCQFLFEASVCGGIPIIKTLHHSFAGERIKQISGILNGTTNFILTKMGRENSDFSEALAEAQRLGYAERNPDADVLGHDTCRKLAILTSLAIGRQVDYTDIYTEGITEITANDMQYAKALNCSVKLLAVAKIDGGNVFARVSPALIQSSHPLSVANDVYNAVFISGNAVGSIMLSGKGAGKEPTGSAVVSDIIEAVRYKNMNIPYNWDEEKQSLSDIKLNPVRKLIRVGFTDKTEAVKAINNVFGEVEDINLIEGEFAFITNEMTEKEIDTKLEVLKNTDGIKGIYSQIRMYT